MSLESLLEVVRRRGGTLPEPLAAHLLSASVWRAAAANTPVRPGMIFLDPANGVLLDRTRLPPPQSEQQGYVAPEVIFERASPSNPSALVYAAGALGYQLITGEAPPPPPVNPGPELDRPLGSVVRVALAPRPVDRFRGLEDMGKAIEAVHPALTPELEKHLFSALLALCSRWLPEGRSSPAQAAELALERIGATGPLSDLAQEMRKLDATVEQIQQQQLELVVHLVSTGVLGGVRARPAEVREPSQEQQDPLQHQLELLQRIAAMTPRPAESAEPAPARTAPAPAVAPPRGTPWMSWAGGMAAGIIGAVGILLLNEYRAARSSRAVPVDPGVAVPVDPGPVVPAPVVPGAEAEPPRAPKLVAEPLTLEVARPAEEPANAAPAPAPPGAATDRPPPATATQQAEAQRVPPRTVTRSKAKPAGSPARGHVRSGERALRQGRGADALSEFEAAVAADPRLAAAHRGLGMAHMMLGQEKAARGDFKRYLELAPDADDAARIRRVVENLDADAK